MGLTLGAKPVGGDRCQFSVWAPRAEWVEVRIFDAGSTHRSPGEALLNSGPGTRLIRLSPTGRGYHQGLAEGIPAGTRYAYCLDGKIQRPDPASRSQPTGVHGPSEVVDAAAFAWSDGGWMGLPLEDYIIYEAHVGTYSGEENFAGIIPLLDELKDLGVTALELMPIAQFPGARNWGYDGAYPFAVQNSYGGTQGLQRLVNACHARGLAVILDVVYNHLGPEGNYLGDFGPYFTDRYKSPWGQALNFDGRGGDDVARFFIENALYWLRDLHIDALRLDAIHGIVDCNARPFLQMLSQAVHAFAEESGRKVYLIAESDLNDARFLQPAESGGHGLDAQWNDDFHHALHTILTGEDSGYYLDFGRLGDLQTAWGEGYVYTGQYSAYRGRRHGNSSRQIAPRRFVVFAQNHDQVGNRRLGDRLSALVSLEALKLAAGMVVLSSGIPLLFMGEEWGERAPFQYFTSHSDPALVEAVRRGRREEFAAFGWQGEIPDPQDPATFSRSKPDHTLKLQEPYRTLRDFYREIIRLRKALPALSTAHGQTEAGGNEERKTLWIRRWADGDEALIIANLSAETRMVTPNIFSGGWCRTLDSADQRWKGPGSCTPSQFDATQQVQMNLLAHSLALFRRLR